MTTGPSTTSAAPTDSERRILGHIKKFCTTFMNMVGYQPVVDAFRNEPGINKIFRGTLMMQTMSAGKLRDLGFNATMDAIEDSGADFERDEIMLGFDNALVAVINELNLGCGVCRCLQMRHLLICRSTSFLHLPRQLRHLRVFRLRPRALT